MQNNEHTANTTQKDSIKPSEHRISTQSDEIDLVDLFLFFWDRRRLFLSSMMLIAVVGIIGFEVLDQSQSVSTVQSVVEVRRSAKGTSVVTPKALARRIVYVDLPQLSSAPEYDSIRSHILATTSEAIAHTNMVEITSVVSNSDPVDIVKFHERLIERISADVTFPSIPVAEEISHQLDVLKESIARLQQMIIKRGQQVGTGAKKQDRSSRVFLRQIEFQGNHLKNIQNSLFPKFRHLVSGLSNNEFRVLVRGRVSTESIEGVKASTAYVLIIVFAVFAAVLIIAVRAFVQKVMERMAGRG